MRFASRRLVPFVGGFAVVAGIIATAVGLRVVFGDGEPPPPREWLTELEQEQFADLVVSFLPDEPIAACLWKDVVQGTSSTFGGSPRPLGAGRRGRGKAARD